MARRVALSSRRRDGRYASSSRPPCPRQRWSRHWPKPRKPPPRSGRERAPPSTTPAQAGGPGNRSQSRCRESRETRRPDAGSRAPGRSRRGCAGAWPALREPRPGRPPASARPRPPPRSGHNRRWGGGRRGRRHRVPRRRRLGARRSLAASAIVGWGFWAYGAHAATELAGWEILQLLVLFLPFLTVGQRCWRDGEQAGGQGGRLRAPPAWSRRAAETNPPPRA